MSKNTNEDMDYLDQARERQQLENMGLHEFIVFKAKGPRGEMVITRVIGGWIYETQNGNGTCSSAFVPEPVRLVQNV